MKLLFDFFPILIFFICYKMYGIYTATAVAIVAAVIQVLFHRIKYRQFEKMHLISLALISILGGATLFFHNPWFIKWKPTGIYWLTAIVFVGSSFFGKKTLIEKMMDGNITLPTKVWGRLNIAWALFFTFMGALNLYVAYYYSTDFWVNFKLFGGAGLTVFFIILQAVYLTNHVSDKGGRHSSPRDSHERF